MSEKTVGFRGRPASLYEAASFLRRNLCSFLPVYTYCCHYSDRTTSPGSQPTISRLQPQCFCSSAVPFLPITWKSDGSGGRMFVIASVFGEWAWIRGFGRLH
jgi:hypothetical protein